MQNSSENKTNTEAENQSKRPRSAFIGIFIVAAVCIIMAFPMIIFPQINIRSFKEAVNSCDYDKAEEIYFDAGEKSSMRGLMDKFLMQKTESEFASYKNGKSDIDSLETYLNAVSGGFNLPGLAPYRGTFEKLKESHAKYTEGVAFENENNLAAAILSYMDVAKNDPMYIAVCDKISVLKESYRQQLENALLSYSESKNFAAALAAIDDAQKIYGEASYAAERERFTMLKDEADKQEAYLSQAVSAYDAHVSLKGNGEDDLLVATVKNNSEKIVTAYIVAFCAYDNNEKIVLLASKAAPNEPTEYVRCQNKSVQLHPGSNTGTSFGWAIASGATVSRLDACVISAEFDDGSSWSNPYYKYWCRDNGIVTID